MIEIQQLRKAFGKNKVLNGVNLEFRRGSITGLAGPNAGGKTTLIKCILGLIVPDSGTVRIDGEIADPEGSFRRKIGYIPQNPNFPNNLNLEELMRMLEDLRREKAAKKEELVALFGLDRMKGQPFGELSGGSKQKIAIVTAFMFDAQILICDEPSSGLDPVSHVLFKKLLLGEAERGKSIIVVSHQLAELEQLASHVAFLSNGKPLFSGGTEELRAETGAPDLETAITALYSGKQAVIE